MPIVFSRVEERLIHGQVSYSWSTVFNFDAFVVIDNSSATDLLQRSLLELACPPGKKLFIYTEEEAIKNINTINQSLFLVAKYPETYLNLYKNGVTFTNLNIGSINHRPNTKEVYRTLWLTDADIQALKELMDLGVECEMQKLPTEKVINLRKLIL